MFRVVKQIDFCYGHRLLDYEGKCRNLHGHNGRVEIELSGGDLDRRGMVADFGDIKRLIKPWIDEHLDHRMILRADDPAREFLQAQGERVFVVDANPTAETIARLIFTKAREFGLPVTCVRMWETADSCAEYSAAED